MALERGNDDDGGIAAGIGNSAHQLCEPHNAGLGTGFSRYPREWRVGSARARLVAEPSASVLSVGINVGLAAQSNFHEACREIEGITPGQFRKLDAHKRDA
ncbi:MAG: AraC family transcriptional regulator [Candidatus Accumulibacter sp.]|nr:AraC family transcriptional regulator [Accumulibacter sp.]